MFLTILGVTWVITEKNQHSYNPQARQKLGIIWGIIAAMSQASAAVISRYVLVESGIAPLPSTLIRLIGGTLIILPLLLFLTPNQKLNSREKITVKICVILVITAFGSTYLGIWLQQTALKYAQTGIATTLLATSPLFILPIAKLRGEKISLRSILGVIIALIGITTLQISF